jgi:superfamily II DNA or RNA helicase
MKLRRQVHSQMEFGNEAKTAESIANHMPDFGCFHVNGSIPTYERENIMTEFRAASMGL